MSKQEDFLHGAVNLNRYGKFLVLVGTIDVVGVIGDVGDDSVYEKKNNIYLKFFCSSHRSFNATETADLSK